MRVHRFSIDETKRKTKENVYHHMRRFWHVYTDDDVEKFDAHIETIVKKPSPEFSIRFHVGNAGSETPFDGHLTVFGTGLYWGISAGRKLAQRLTSSPEYMYDGRDISLRLGDGRLWTRVWAPDDRWQRGEFPKWRYGSFKVNLLDRIYGEKRYSYETIDERSMILDIADDKESYPVFVKLQRCTLKRPKSKREIISYCVEVDAKKGIPDSYDPSGGWKGDRVYGFAVEVRNHERGWDIDARNLIIAYILKNRGMTGFREAQPVDD